MQSLTPTSLPTEDGVAVPDQVSGLPGLPPPTPSQLPNGLVPALSLVTVAGAVPDFHRFPLRSGRW